MLYFPMISLANLARRSSSCSVVCLRVCCRPGFRKTPPSTTPTFCCVFGAFLEPWGTLAALVESPISFLLGLYCGIFIASAAGYSDPLRRRHRHYSGQLACELLEGSRCASLSRHIVAEHPKRNPQTINWLLSGRLR